jgi:hypothetical protein
MFSNLPLCAEASSLSGLGPLILLSLHSLASRHVGMLLTKHLRIKTHSEITELENLVAEFESDWSSNSMCTLLTVSPTVIPT